MSVVEILMKYWPEKYLCWFTIDAILFLSNIVILLLIESSVGGQAVCDMCWVQTGMCLKCKRHTEFPRFKAGGGVENAKYLISNFCIDYVLK